MFTRREPGHVTGVAANVLKQALAANGFGGFRAASRWRQETKEVLKIVDPSQPGSRVSDIFGVRFGVARLEPACVRFSSYLCSKEVVGNAHLVQVSIAGKSQERCLLGFPPKAADALTPGGDILNDRSAPSYAVAIFVVRVSKGGDGLIRNGLNEPCAEERYGDSVRDDVCLFVDGANRDLTSMWRNGKEVHERAAGRGVEVAIFVTETRAHLNHGARSTHGRDVVALST